MKHKFKVGDTVRIKKGNSSTWECIYIEEMEQYEGGIYQIQQRVETDLWGEAYRLEDADGFAIDWVWNVEWLELHKGALNIDLNSADFNKFLMARDENE